MQVLSVKTDRPLNFARDNWAQLRVAAAALATEDGVLREFDDSPASLAALADVLDSTTRFAAFNAREFDLKVLTNHFGSSRVDGWSEKLVDPFEIMRTLTGSWVKLTELIDANPVGQDEGWEARESGSAAESALALWRILGSPRERPSLRFPVKTWSAAECASVITGWATLNWLAASGLDAPAIMPPALEDTATRSDHHHAEAAPPAQSPRPMTS
jgi:hypothetical protein